MEYIKKIVYFTISVLTLSFIWVIINLVMHTETSLDKIVFKGHNESHHIDLSDMQDPKEVITTCYGFICKVSIKHFEVVKRKKGKR